MRLPAGVRRWPALRAAVQGIAVVALLAAGVAAVYGAPTSNITITAHNLSQSGTKTVAAPSGGETQICAFCHTPHGANTVVGGPLWNRNASGNSYTRYTSGSLHATNITDGFNDQPAGSSVLCLSCHDGLVALGNVNVLRGKSSPAAIALNGTNSGKMPIGVGVNSGFTRVIGTDLSNDHPISITYDSDLTTAVNGSSSAPEELRRLDGNQRYPADSSTPVIGRRGNGIKPLLPLESTGKGTKTGIGQMQCATCHDPHITADKFLRLNRFQLDTPTGTGFSEANDQICLACHVRQGTAWAESAHANPVTADEKYTTAAAALRQFTIGGQPVAVWQAGCLNCHDSHSTQGSRRLLREGVNGDPPSKIASGTAAGAAFYAGFAAQADNQTTSAVENTCFQCHRDAGTGADNVQNALTAAGSSTVPSIKSLFDATYGMPIRTDDQKNGTKEVHNISNADFLEDQTNLGRFAVGNRHVECTDCHNPHRVRRSRTFAGKSAGTGDGAQRTHTPGGKTGDISTGNGNIASGVLRGSWGVEPTMPVISYTSWPQFPTGFDVKKGEPGNVAVPTTRAETLAASYLTREYQLCFKCHSNYANGETKTDFPPLQYVSSGTCRRCTPKSLANGMTTYTNVAAEFLSVTATDPPTTNTDQGEMANSTNNMGNACSGGDCAPRANGGTSSDTTYNHRSWHPVVYPTGRDRKERNMASTGNINLLAPFAANIGVQTMHCSDCHGQESSWTAGTGPTANTVQGPHGSSNPFLLRGVWDDNVTLSNVNSSTPRKLCGTCHQPKTGNSNGGSGLNTNHVPDGDMSSIKCMVCHIAVPHGWKNKAFLVNLNCVGKEGGETSDCVDKGSSASLDAAPYYWKSKLYISSWARSGSWSSSSCGGSSMTGASC
jgi:hypothetical protein